MSATEHRRLMAFGVVLVIVGVLSAVSVVLSWTASARSIAVSEREEHNARCNRAAFEAYAKRDKVSTDLRKLTDEDRDNLANLVRSLLGANGSRTPADMLRAFLDASDRINTERAGLRAEQDRATLVTLAECEVPS